jgi:DNA-binding CsgD family transcriptional regulator
MTTDLPAGMRSQNQILKSISVVGNLVLPLEDEERVLDVIAEQIIRAARIRSLVLAIVFRDKGYLEIVRSARFNKLGPDGKITEHSAPSVERISGRREDIYRTPDSFICRAVRDGDQIVVDAAHADLDPNSPYWRNKVAYFIKLQHGNETVAVLCGACPLDEKDHALDWVAETEPLTDLIAAQIRTLRILKEQRFLPYRPPQPVNLSSQEIEVLSRVALGESAPEIAAEMALSPRTVHTYKRRICKKLDRYSQADLTRYAIMTGLIPLTDR